VHQVQKWIIKIKKLVSDASETSGSSGTSGSTDQVDHQEFVAETDHLGQVRVQESSRLQIRGCWSKVRHQEVQDHQNLLDQVKVDFKQKCRSKWTYEVQMNHQGIKWKLRIVRINRFR
jgi:hypothetical protein